jgi:phage recombination protein Bet
MGMEIVKSPNGAPEWESKIELIKKTVAKGATDDELQLFFHQAKKTGLDPLARQIYFVKRQGSGTIQTAIDGYRLIADRTGKYAGNDDYEFDDPEKQPKWAKARVWKMVEGQRCPFEATARWSQYYPGDAQGWAWKKMPHVMLGKCAEALALRKAFPAELSGIYTNEEMAQDGDLQGAPESTNCEQCGNEIVGGKWGDHKYNADQVLILSRRLHDGKEFCGDCLAKLKDKKPEALNPAVEMARDEETGEWLVKGYVTKVTAGVNPPLLLELGNAELHVWHKNSLLPHFKDSKGKLIDVVCRESAGRKHIEKVNSIGKQKFVDNKPATDLEATTVV